LDGVKKDPGAFLRLALEEPPVRANKVGNPDKNDKAGQKHSKMTWRR
jgi:hypothetical protein